VAAGGTVLALATIPPAAAATAPASPLDPDPIHPDATLLELEEKIFEQYELATAFKQTAYALDRDSRKAALARFLKRASGSDQEAAEEERRLAA
jgi:hypothetical protein